MKTPIFENLLAELGHSIELDAGKVSILSEATLREKAGRLAEISALGGAREQTAARFLARAAALAAGIYPASIHEMYIARGRGDVPATFTVPAMNLRALSYDAARAILRAAQNMDAAALIFEIARSEIGYTDQRPSEYATNIFAAALNEGYRGPVFIQGDHFQVSAKRFAADAEGELQAVKELIREAIDAGFYNIDVDTSTLVDLSKGTIAEQQDLNAGLSASLTAYIREIEPEGITVSVGGEIGEVGGKNSTAEELRAYMDGYIQKLGEQAPGATGLSKISIQTGTSHGGVVLPDGSLASVSIDFDTLLQLSRLAREEYGMAGAVQHGASTLPQEAFGKFTESEACEVHLATNFQNMLYDRLPQELLREIYTYLEANHSQERKSGQTDEQFYYKTRKHGIGPFKAQMWGMESAAKEAICRAWEEQFRMLFELLNLGGTREYIQQHTSTVQIAPTMDAYHLGEATTEDTSDLAD